jgi:hypothetical protein
VARPDLDGEFDEDEFVEEFGKDEPSAPWHNSTPAVIGASLLGIAIIGVLIAGAMYLTRQDNTPSAPAEFVDPTFSSIASETTSTTTETITSTAPLSTTEINGPSSTTTGSDTSGSSTTSSSGESPPPATIHTREPQQEVTPGAPTSRRPRFNVTRTLPPQQAG